MDENNTNVTNLIPPQDLEAEKAVLGSMMKDQDAVSDVIDRLRADDFYLKEHQQIYEVMLDMYRKSVGIDLMTVYSALNEKKLTELVGGMTYLSQLVNEAIVSSNAKYYAETVVAKARMRQLIKEAEAMRSQAYAGGKDAEDILDRAEQRIFEIAHRAQKKNYVSINTVFEENMRQLQELEKNKGQIPGIATGFRDVDKILTGIQPSDLVILAARPGMGKTSFALNIAANVAEAGKSVLVFSLEMSKEQLGQRVLSMESSVEMEKMKTGNLSPDEWMALSEAQDNFEDRKIFIDEVPEMTLLEMKNKCRRLKAEQGLDLVIIDYLQLMSLGYGGDNRTNEVSAITRAIKIMAKELDVAIILLSQLNRDAERRTDHRPQLADLRDSGSIEQDADIVIFLKREDYYNKNEDDPAEINPNVGNTCEVIIAKHRNGDIGSCNLAWVAKYTKFGNLAHTFEGTF